MISENPLVPNAMTNEQYLANQFASGTPPVGVPRQPAQPVSPVADLAQLGQAGLQGSQNQQRTASKVSQRVGGLLGGDQQGVGGLLSDVQGEAALQGLFATMQAIGRPVRRGEDRFMGATQYGQQVMDAAQKRGMADLSTQIELDKYQRAVRKAEQDRANQQVMQQFLMGQAIPSATTGGATQMPTGTTGVLTPEAQAQAEGPQRAPLDDALSSRYDAYEIGQMTDVEKQSALQAMRFEQAAQYAASRNMSDEAKSYRDQADALNQQIGAKFLSREQRSDLSWKRRDAWAKNEYQPRAEQIQSAQQLINLVDSDPNALNDVAIIFGFMKTLDPRSTVREGEADMVQAAQGAYQRLQTLAAQVQSGRILPDTAYDDIRDIAKTIAKAAKEDYKYAVDKNESVFEERGLDVDIVIPYREMKALGGSTASPSTTIGGGASIINTVTGGVTGGRSAAAQ
jgi:hypothetical protein